MAFLVIFWFKSVLASFNIFRSSKEVICVFYTHVTQKLANGDIKLRARMVYVNEARAEKWVCVF